MPYTVEEFIRESLPQILQRLTPEERLKGLTLEEVLRALPPEYQAALRALEQQRQQALASETSSEPASEEEQPHRET